MASTFNAGILSQEIRTTGKNSRRKEQPIEAPEWLKKYFVPNQKIQLANKRILKWQMVWMVCVLFPSGYLQNTSQYLDYTFFIYVFSSLAFLSLGFNMKFKKVGFFLLCTLFISITTILFFLNSIFLFSSIYAVILSLLFIQTYSVFQNRDFIKAQSFGTVHSVWEDGERFFFLHTDLLFILDKLHPSFWQKRLTKVYFNSNKIIVYDTAGNRMYVKKNEVSLKSNSLLIHEVKYSLKGWDKASKEVIQRVFSE